MSDLTNTVFAKIHHLHLWQRYGELLIAGHSVRECARRLGIDKDTAWRWRHRLLGALATRELPALRGIIETHETNFAFSQKGSRRLRDATGIPRRPRRRGDRRWSGSQHRVWVVLARDRTGRSRAVVTGERRPGTRTLELVFNRRDTDAVTALLSTTGPLGPFGTLCRRRRIRFVGVRRSGDGPAAQGWWTSTRGGGAVSRKSRLDKQLDRGLDTRRLDPAGDHPSNCSSVPTVSSPDGDSIGRAQEVSMPLPDTLVHTRSVREQEARLRVWLRRFRGVATRYLQNYLVWHGMVDVLERPGDVMLFRSVDAAARPTVDGDRALGSAKRGMALPPLQVKALPSSDHPASIPTVAT